MGSRVEGVWDEDVKLPLFFMAKLTGGRRKQYEVEGKPGRRTPEVLHPSYRSL